MRIEIKSLPLKLILIAAESAVFVILTLWVGKAYFADLVSRRFSAENLGLASRLDPGNSDYHLKLGRIYQYSRGVDPRNATEPYGRPAVARLGRRTGGGGSY